MAFCEPAPRKMVQMEQTTKPAEKPPVAQYVVQNATRSVCPLECMPRLLIARRILKSRMNREVHVRFCEDVGVKFPCVTRLAAVLLSLIEIRLCQFEKCFL